MVAQASACDSGPLQDAKMTNMEVVQVTLPADLLRAAGVNPAYASREAAMLLTLELYRENKSSLGRAAELCQTSVEAFMVFAGRHDVPMQYSATDLEEDRRTLGRLSS
jgi:predicted HTH domain antitoxin